MPHSLPYLTQRRPLGYGSAAAAQGGSEAEFVKYAERRVASRIVESRRKLPPMINDSALFTLASPYGAPKDPYYHAPSTRIASHYTPGAGFASAVLFEEFPQVCFLFAAKLSSTCRKSTLDDDAQWSSFVKALRYRLSNHL